MSLRYLDDDSLLKILSILSAREIAKLALVCKRWRDLSCAVSQLSFEFTAATKEELRTQEGIIASVLCRASSREPGSLKRLHVSFTSTCSEEAEINGHWLLWTTPMSLTILELASRNRSVGWGPVVWSSIMRMRTLEKLTIEGNFSAENHLLLPQVLANGLQMVRLQYCRISDLKKISVALLDTIFATCPALTELHVTCEDTLTGTLRVASNSLTTFNLMLGRFDGLASIVHVPSLTTLNLFVRSGSVSIDFESAHSLRRLNLRSSYRLYNPPKNVQELKLYGACDLEWLWEMLMCVPNITDLYFVGSKIARRGRIDIDQTLPIDIDQILSLLVNLRNIHFENDALSGFHAGEKRAEALNIHLWPSPSYAPEVSLLKALLEVHKIQSLVVHGAWMIINHNQERTVRKGYEKWGVLLELSYLYPDCVKFV